MLTTVHLVAGVAIGQATGNVYLSAVFSFISHYFFDAIPHYSFKPLSERSKSKWHSVNIKQALLESIEPFFGFGLAFYFVSQQQFHYALPMFVGAVFSWLPDLLVFLEWQYGIKRPWPIRPIEIAIHRHWHTVGGILIQVVVLIPMVWYLYSKM